MIWYFAMILNFLCFIIGSFCHFLYIQHVILNTYFDRYCRFGKFLSCLGMLFQLWSNTIVHISCLQTGTFFEEGPCSQYVLHEVCVIIHTIGEYLAIAGIDVLIFDRICVVLFINFHGLKRYDYIYSLMVFVNFVLLANYLYFVRIRPSSMNLVIATVMISVMLLVSFVWAAFLIYISKQFFYRTMGKLPLAKRYKFFESYEFSKCILPSISFALFSRFFLCSLFAIFSFGFIPDDFTFKLYYIINLVSNLDATLFPSLFLFVHKPTFRKILSLKKNRVHQISTMNLDGSKFRYTQTQQEYFNQLKNTWK